MKILPTSDFSSLCILASALLLATPALEAASPPSRIALFGGSSSATTYLPTEHKHQTVLREELQKQYPGQKIEVFNFADNGEFIARYLLRGQYTKDHAALQRKNLDIAILRCGINDSKRFSPTEFAEQCRRFIKLLQSDFPGIQIILETGFYLDYPKHYASDRNKILLPYWEVTQQLAEELNLPLSDIYKDSQKATAEGDWDIRVRSQNDKRYPKKPKGIYWETTLDEEYGSDPQWFNDVHPNPHGVRMAVNTEIRLLKNLYPNALPSGTGATSGERHRPQSFYIDWIGCTPEQIKLKRENPDELQEATRTE